MLKKDPSKISVIISFLNIRTICKQSPGSLSTSSQASLNAIGLHTACELANNLRLGEEEEYYTPYLKKEELQD